MLIYVLNILFNVAKFGTNDNKLIAILGPMPETLINILNKSFSKKISIPIYVSIRMNLPHDSFFDQNYHTYKNNFQLNKLNAYIKLLTSLNNAGVKNYNLNKTYQLSSKRRFPYISRQFHV